MKEIPMVGRGRNGTGDEVGFRGRVNKRWRYMNSAV